MNNRATSPTALSPPDRQRLAKLLGLLGSDYAGERDAAGLAAHRFVASLGLTWPDVLQPEVVSAANRDFEPWRETVAACLRQPGSLRPWETDFLRSVTSFGRLSPKQKAALDRIAERVLRSDAA